MPTTRLVRITTAAPVTTTLTLIDGTTDTGYNLLADSSWGDTVWEHLDAGMRGTQGRAAAGGYPLERQARISLRVAGATKTDADARIAALDQAVDELRIYGGLVTVREHGSAYRVHLEVLRVVGVATTSRNDATARRDVAVDLVCGPFLYGDPLDYTEQWLVDTVASGEWTLDEGTVTSAGGGRLDVAGTSRLRLTGPGYTLGDCDVIVEWEAHPVVISTASVVASVCASTSGADTMLAAEMTSSALRVVKRVGGSATTLATTAYAPAAGGRYWVGVRREGAVVTASVWVYDPVLGLDTPAATVSYALTAAEQAAFTKGHAAIRLGGDATAGLVYTVRVRPYTYSGVPTPTHIELGGAVPGTAPALFDLHITPGSASGSGATGTYAKAYPVYLLAGWGATLPANCSPLVGDYNVDSDGNGIADLPTGAYITSGVTSIANAATSIEPTVATAKYGRVAIAVVTPGSVVAEGVAVRVFGEYRRGRTVTAIVWAKASSGTPSVQLRVGSSAGADRADGSAVTLSTTTWSLLSVTWSPTADRQDVFAAIVATAASAASFVIDGLVVWQSDPAALAVAMGSASRGDVETITVAATPDRVVAPCLALVDSELVYVQSTSGASWTVVRGAEQAYSSPPSHLSGALVYALPPLREHVEGNGGFAPLGVVYAANVVAQQGSPVAVVSDADYVSGWGARIDTAADGSWYVGDVAIDPALVAPDPYVDAVDVEVYARIDVDNDWTAVRAAVGARPLRFSTAAARWSNEYGSAGKLLLEPADATGLERFAFLGTLTLPAESGQWLLRTLVYGTRSGTARFGIDHYLLVPRRSNARSPEAKLLDSTYPEAFPSVASERARVFYADGSGALVPAGQQDARVPYHGLGGAPLELAPGNQTLVVKLSNMVPDHPVEAATGADYERISAAIHVAVTPRYMTVRDA